MVQTVATNVAQMKEAGRGQAMVGLLQLWGILKAEVFRAVNLARTVDTSSPSQLPLGDGR